MAKKKVYITMDKLTDIEHFCNLAGKIEGGVTVTKGRFVSDGASILGVIAINPPTGITVEYDATDATFEFDTFVDAFKA